MARTAPADPNTLYVLTTLRLVNGRYRFVIRWIPGASDEPTQGDNLPTAADIFTVTIRRPGTRLYLQPDWTWSANPNGFDVRALPYAMIDPPRRGAPIPDAPSVDDQWLVAIEPTAPVDPSLKTLSLTPLSSAPMGVCHLLDNLDKDRVAYRVWRCFSAAASNYAKRQSGTRIAFTETEAQNEAVRLATRLVRSGLRPRHLPAIIAADQATLRARTRKAEADGLVDRQAPRLAAAWRRLAFASAMAEDEAALQAADYDLRSATQTRQQLRLKALQGGELIDFWGGLDVSEPVVAPLDRGKAYPSAKLLGLGVDLGDFSAADVQSWCAPLPNGSNDFVSIEVTHRLDPNQTRTFGIGRGRTGHLRVRPRYDYDKGSTMLKVDALQGALANGSSNPPLTPSAAWVNFDLVKSWTNPDAQTKPADGEQDTALNFTTGDGRVEILIKPAPPNLDANGNTLNTVVGYNVYGVWEGASAASDQWFQPGHEPSLADLKPWLITRRYSLYRDLAPALPPVNMAPHPALVSALTNPAWHPTLLRTDNLTDIASGKGESIPSVTNTQDDGKTRLTVFGFDLRRGSQVAPALPPGVPGAWDPVYTPMPGWMPEVWRATLGAHPQPQGYRFWVTAVDSMEQESAPLAVSAEDKDAGQDVTLFYKPTRRTQLRAPPRASDADAGALTFVSTGDRKSVRVTCGTPNAFLLGTNSGPDEPSSPLDPAGLRAIVQVLRRRLKAPLQETLKVHRLSTNPTLDSKAWSDARAPLLAQGWEAWTDTTVEAPAAKGLWTADFPLKFEDRSYEYLALVGFRVKGPALPFWHPPTAARSVQVTVPDTTSGVIPPYKLSIQYVEETAGIGSVATSATIAVQADAVARAAAPAQVPFELAVADPVLPPPSVNRDTVLMRLISQPVSTNGAPVAALPWPDAHGPTLTRGQVATCETAMSRVHYPDKMISPPPSADEDLAIRRALARLCAGDGTSQRLLRNPMLGFRGLGSIRWRYTPFAASPPKVDSAGKPTEAETSLFRIYTAAAPHSLVEAVAAPLQGDLRRLSNGRFEISHFTGDPAATAALSSGQQPALVRVTTTQDPAFANLRAFESSGGVFLADLDPLDGDLPKMRAPAVPVQIYMGRIAREVPNSRFDAESDCSAWAPIPGGPAEMIAWWVSSVSAEQKTSPMSVAAWPMTAQKFAASVQPRAPASLGVRQVKSVSDYKYNPLDPTQKIWCPSQLDALGAEFLPRLYLSWEKPDVWAGAGVAGGAMYVEVDREYEHASRQTSRLILHADAVTPWQAIRDLETVPADAAIDLSWIDAIRDNWLLGKEVEVEAKLIDDPAFIRADDRQLDAAGLVIETGQSADVAVRFIDYYAQPNTNRDEVMESDYRYRHRLRYAQDLGSTSGWKYLRSEWTDWSDFVLPISPELSPQLLQTSTANFPEIAPPRVRFVISSKPVTLRRARHHAAFRRGNVDWLYRVMIYRQVQSLLTQSSGANGALDWIEVGSALALKPDETMELLDDGFERSAYGQAMSLQYRFVLQQIARDDDTQEERPVRTATNGLLDFTVAVPAPKTNQDTVQEVEVVQSYNVR